MGLGDGGFPFERLVRDAQLSAAQFRIVMRKRSRSGGPCGPLNSAFQGALIRALEQSARTDLPPGRSSARGRSRRARSGAARTIRSPEAGFIGDPVEPVVRPSLITLSLLPASRPHYSLSCSFKGVISQCPDVTYASSPFQTLLLAGVAASWRLWLHPYPRRGADVGICSR